MESAAKIRGMVLRNGRSMRSVSRETGLSRNMIQKYLKDSSPPSYQRQGDPVRHKLCDFEEQRWSREFGPFVKVDRMIKEVIQNEETKEPFA